ncbi:hypothetical protein GOC21_25265 [Sinorhizobium meliloti]|nr:hypothetical protein [Sinorhizobium meliloti]
MGLPVTRRLVLCSGLAAAASVPLGWLGRTWAAGRLPSQRIALVIGNAKYAWDGCDDKACRLNSPERDATAIEEMFKRLNFQTVCLINADYSSMKGALAAFQRRAAISDVAAFYYSGHGIQMDGSNYLLPSDASSIFYDSFNNARVPLKWGSEAIGGANRLGLMLIDACRDNPYLSAVRKEPQHRTRDVSASLAPIDPPNDFLVGYATKGGLVARDGTENDLSPYAASIIRYLGDSRLSVEEALRLVSTSVCDLTSPARLDDVEHSECQQPVVYGVFGVPPHYLIDDEAAIDVKTQGPLLTNLKMADPSDPAMRAILGRENPQFTFKYVLDTHPEKPSIYPELDYFSSMRDGRIRPFFVAKQTLFIEPGQGGGTWSLSYPLFDLIARRVTRASIEIGAVVVDSRNSRIDDTPYASVITEEAHLFGITVVNQSSFDELDVQIEIDVVGFSKQSSEELDELLAKHGNLFEHTISTKVTEFERLDIFEWIEPKVPDITHLLFLLDHSIEDEDGVLSAFRHDTGEVNEMVEVPPGFERWYRKGEETGFVPEYPFWVIGRVKSIGPSGQRAEADFAAAVLLYAEAGGGGTIPYDLFEQVNLPVDGRPHRMVKSIGLTLNSDKKTFRGLFPTVAETSSFHDVRVSVLDSRGNPLYVSPWISTHIYVSDIDKRHVETDLLEQIDPFEEE